MCSSDLKNESRFCSQENPFRHRICSVFSRDGDGISFEDFLDMLSAFSEQAPRDIKVYYAFRIYGTLSAINVHRIVSDKLH